VNLFKCNKESLTYLFKNRESPLKEIIIIFIYYIKDIINIIDEFLALLIKLMYNYSNKLQRTYL